VNAGGPTRRWPDILRWGACFVFVLTFHAAGAMALMAHWNTEPDLVANAPVIMIELAPVPVAPQTKPTELAPGPVQSEAQPEPQPEPEKPIVKLEPEPVKPIEKAELPPPLPPVEPMPQAEPMPVVMPPPRPPEEPKKVEKPKEKSRQRHASIASAPSSADREATRAAAPAPGASSHNPYAVSTWKSQLVARLERSKRYPSEAQARGEHGVAQLAFSVDRSGRVHNARIVRSSGSSVLDSATLALVERAAPLPPPPPEVPGAQIAISVPIRYNMR
jgi:protein TonB